MKIRPWGAGLFHEEGRTERRTDMTKLVVAFRNFSKAPKYPGVSLFPYCHTPPPSLPILSLPQHFAYR